MSAIVIPGVIVMTFGGGDWSRGSIAATAGGAVTTLVAPSIAPPFVDAARGAARCTSPIH